MKVQQKKKTIQINKYLETNQTQIYSTIELCQLKFSIDWTREKETDNLYKPNLVILKFGHSDIFLNCEIIKWKIDKKS